MMSSFVVTGWFLAVVVVVDGGGAVLLAWAKDVGFGVSCASDVLVVGWETRLLLTDDVSFGSAWI